MNRILKYIFIGFVAISLLAIIWPTSAHISSDFNNNWYFPLDTPDITPDDTIKLKYNFSDEDGNPYTEKKSSGLYLKEPSNISSEIEYDPINNEYKFTQKIGELNYRQPYSMSLEEYLEYDHEQAMKNYWVQRARSISADGSTRKGFMPQLNIKGDFFQGVFGSSTISIRPQGSAELIFALESNKIDNPMLSPKLRRTTTFDFDEKIQMNVTGEIGDKMKLTTKYNTEASFEFENKMKLAYEGKEDEILQKLEAGDVTLPLSGSLITGSQSLFGFKTELKFGRLTATTVFSQQKGKTSVIEVEGGAQTTRFEVNADDYEANKHFFLGHYFNNVYDKSLSQLPQINSGVRIDKIEVWITNKTSNYEESRNILAFIDLGEGYNINKPYTDNVLNNENISINQGFLPQNDINSLYDQISDDNSIRSISSASNRLEALGYSAGKDFEKIENARKLRPTEYTFNSSLGFISLNSSLNSDEILGVAYQYTIIETGEIVTVGEFSTDGVSAPNNLVVKLIKGTTLSPRTITWDLMMKNVYSLGAYQVSNEDFMFDIYYRDDKRGTATNYIPAGAVDGKLLLQVFRLDTLNSQNEPYPDGYFDFVQGVTINASNGRVYFPVLEPFGSYLKSAISRNNPADTILAQEYIFEELYDSTQTIARQMAEKNKFFFSGSYKSSSGSDIPLNAMNIPQGSVKVTAGGMELAENVDYTVDYTLGRVKILNQGILESGQPIKISMESQSIFNIQTKTLIGTHLDYKVNNNFMLGATVLNLTERPLTQKSNFGDEPISNTIWGIDGNYRTDVPFVTKMVDKLPFLETKETSTLTVMGEFAHIIPGHPKIKGAESEGAAYIDDFEGSKTSIDVKSFSAWSISSTPLDFNEATLSNDQRYGMNRARLSWYVIDPHVFLRNTSSTPDHIKNSQEQNNHFVREIFEKDIFKEKETVQGVPTNLSVLNLAYYPKERGPYNFDTDVDFDGNLLNPEDRWGGVMRKIESSDFETANIEYIEFWMMDPFVYKEDNYTGGGELKFNLGNVSEDILKDSRKTFEHGFPTPSIDRQVDSTAWGLVPKEQSIVSSFSNNETDARSEDIGLDGLTTVNERTFYSSDNPYWSIADQPYLDRIQEMKNQNLISQEAYDAIYNDPSSDNYHYYRGTDYDNSKVSILDRYKRYNGLEGNSFSPSEETYPTSGTSMPDFEDINRDNTLSEAESYFQYKVSIKPEDLEIGKNYITDAVVVAAKDGDVADATWYQFKIPIADWEKTYGTIDDFKSIRFMRMFLTGFNEDVVLRFAKLDLVRGEWRKYNFSLMGPSFGDDTEINDGAFDISAVNVEENSGKEPINYVLPPGINRIVDPNSPQLRQLNEQSMVLKVLDLADGDAKAAFKNIELDVRQYKRLEMEIHAEAIPGISLNDDDLTLFVRLGSDYRNNFYEYEIPLKLTEPKADGFNKDELEDRKLVWPEENRLDIPFEIFQKIKEQRNDLVRAGSISITTIHSDKEEGGRGTVRIKGNPLLSDIRTIMIGIRNPSKYQNPNDDGIEKSGEVWVNELRLTDFKEKGGWAANARVVTKLADFGSITIAGSTSKPGFGSIEKKVNERSKEDIYQYDIASNFELGKFFPEKAKVKLPMFMGISEGFITPEYYPLDPDLPLKDVLNNDNISAEEKNDIKANSQDYTKRKSLNFTNVKINKSTTKPKPWDVGNFSASYAYNETESRNINTLYSYHRNYTGVFAYNYNANPKNVAPFKKNKKMFKSKHLRIAKDFNFYYLPRQFSFRTDLSRQYRESKQRNLNNIGSNNVDMVEIPANIRKDFYLNRVYDFKYDLTKTLKLNFSATNSARVDEQEGRINKADADYNVKRQALVDSVFNATRTTNYQHQYDLRYTLPINKLPMLDWVTSNVSYGGTFNWMAGPRFRETVTSPMVNRIGNTVKNSNNINLSAQLNTTKLYNKVPYLKKVNQKYKRKGRSKRKPKKKMETVYFPEKGQPPKLVKLKAGVPKTINHKLLTLDVTVTVKDTAGKVIKGEMKLVNENKVTFTADKNYAVADILVTGKREKKESLLKKIVDQSLYAVMGVKNIQATYLITGGTVLPGYTPETRIMGMQSYQPDFVPFVLGSQYGVFNNPDDELRARLNNGFGNVAHNNGWISKDTLLNAYTYFTNSKRLTLRSSVEPIPGMRINVTANRNASMNVEDRYLYDTDGELLPQNPIESGSFSMSYITWGSAFVKTDQDGNFSSDVFESFKENRVIIANRLASEREEAYLDGKSPYQYDATPGASGYPDGYDATSQNVLIPAFLAAYSKRSPNSISLSTFPAIPLPNWRVNYNGLSKIKFVKRYLKTVTIGHAYNSTYSVGSFKTNSYYNQEDDGFSYVRDQVYGLNFISQYEINSVNISEMFAPLINIDMTWNNSLITKVEYKKNRNISLTFSNNQIMENIGSEFIIGGGYRVPSVPLTIGKKEFKSDLNLRADFSFKDDVIIIRRIEEETNQLQRGDRAISLNLSADYVLSDRFNMRMFFDMLINKPKVTTSFPRSNMRFGLSVKFMLST